MGGGGRQALHQHSWCRPDPGPEASGHTAPRSQRALDRRPHCLPESPASRSSLHGSADRPALPTQHPCPDPTSSPFSPTSRTWLKAGICLLTKMPAAHVAHMPGFKSRLLTLASCQPVWTQESAGKASSNGVPELPAGRRGYCGGGGDQQMGALTLSTSLS